MKPLHIEVALPFCIRHCMHCSRSVITDTDAARRSEYLKALMDEVDITAKDLGSYRAVSMHVGGGTPQLISAQELANTVTVRDRIAFASDAQILVDVMPGRLTRNDLRTYREAGVNALLVNLVTSQGAEHSKLGRACDPGDANPLFQMFEQERFLEYGISIAMGLPRQTPTSFARTLSDVFFYAPKFVFIEDALSVTCRTPSSAVDRTKMFEKVDALLVPNAYGTVAPNLWALPGHAPVALIPSIDAVGFGLGASSRYDGMWYENTGDVGAYIRAQGNPLGTMACAGEYPCSES